eukprot:UN25129
MSEDYGVRSKRQKFNNNNPNDNATEAIQNDLLDARLTKKILDMAKEQREENTKSNNNKPYRKVQFDISSNKWEDGDSNENLDREEQEYNNLMKNQANTTLEEEKALELFAPESGKENKRLADLLKNRIIANERNNNVGDIQEELEKRMPEKFVKVYRDTGKILKGWKSGRMPDAFKIIPVLDNWEEVLQLTNPENWSPNSMFYATKMFSSNLKENAAQRFYNCVLLPAVRDNISIHKKLNYHYYQAVRKSLFKAKAFYLGFLIPLCMDRCTGKEAIIIGGILA